MAIVETPGICIRTGECQVARLGRGVRIPLGARFICPGCGHSLAPPAQPGVLASRRASMNPVPLAIFAGAGLFVLGGSVLLGWQLGAVRSAHAAAPAASPPPRATVAIASPALPALLPAAHLAPPTRAASATPPAATPPAAITPAAATPAAAPASAAAPTLTAYALPLAQPAMIQRAMARIPAPVAAPAPAAIGQDRPFSTRTVSGGTPVFPASYDPHRSGRVTVSCMIDTDGSPSGCVTIWEQGGRAFATAVNAWLNSGQVRFQPALHQGRAEARRESWTVVFN